MYEYSATLVRVVDGDTLDAIIDLGFGVQVKKRIRLHGINAPESRTRDLEEKKRGKAATQYVQSWFREHGGDNLRGAEFVLLSKELGKFGRVLGIVLCDHRTRTPTYIDIRDKWKRTPTCHNLNEDLVRDGHAVEYDGGKR